MADDSKTPPHVTVPPAAQKDFPELTALVLGSESMNDEERQYWLNILTIMTPEQRKSLEDILMNEKRQLASIDAKYQKTAGSPVDSSKRQEHVQKLRQAETAEQAKEAEAEQALLQSIDSL